MRGDVLDVATVDSVVNGNDSVLSLIGQVKSSPKILRADGTRIIVDAVQKNGVRHIVTLSGGELNVRLDVENPEQPKVEDRTVCFLLRTLSGVSRFRLIRLTIDLAVQIGEFERGTIERVLPLFDSLDEDEL